MKATHPSSTASAAAGVPPRGLPKLLAWLLMFLLVTYIVYTVNLVATTRACDHSLPYAAPKRLSGSRFLSNLTITLDEPEAHHKKHRSVVVDKTEIKHVVFGIAASSKLWDQRKEYIKLWYKPNKMRGVVWMEEPVESHRGDGLPPVRISSDTERFKYSNEHGHRSAIRLSRIVSETLRLGMKNVRWFVMGDDDTVFITDNLVRVLNKYDHTQMYYIGSLSESHLQNIFFSYGMAYGGGGFCISYPLAKALVKMQDGCIQRYPQLYGSDDRMQACMAELGVPLHKEQGFHQYDVYGSLFGLLSAHPVAPLVTLHHLDVVEPIFPDMTRVEALRHLLVPAKIDSAGIIQQSICYYQPSLWTVSISWGYAVQIVRGILTARDMEMPTRTFLNWYRRADYTAYAFNTRPVARSPCQKPYIFYMTNITNSPKNQTWSRYDYYPTDHPFCKWKMDDPVVVRAVEVYKRPDPLLWNRGPRRNCCRVLELQKATGTMVVDVGQCKDGEIAGF